MRKFSNFLLRKQLYTHNFLLKRQIPFSHTKPPLYTQIFFSHTKPFHTYVKTNEIYGELSDPEERCGGKWKKKREAEDEGKEGRGRIGKYGQRGRKKERKKWEKRDSKKREAEDEEKEGTGRKVR